MPEYIDKDKLLNGIECIDISNCTDVDDIFIEIERTIDEQPTADVVEVSHGEWIYGELDIPHCSECGKEVLPNQISEYCPDCGAKMDGKEQTKNDT